MQKNLHQSLRALLIQKDVKPGSIKVGFDFCLRALLIQKDVKLACVAPCTPVCLRALLIQKDVKLCSISKYKFSWFESFVNSERCKTAQFLNGFLTGLRALLIQKDVKPRFLSLF